MNKAHGTAMGTHQAMRGHRTFPLRAVPKSHG